MSTYRLQLGAILFVLMVFAVSAYMIFMSKSGILICKGENRDPLCMREVGRTLAHSNASGVPKDDAGNATTYMRKPLSDCAELSASNEKERVACERGVFAGLSDWMRTGSYGFGEDQKRFFLVCLPFKDQQKTECEEEIASALFVVLNFDLTAFVHYTAFLKTDNARHTVFVGGFRALAQENMSNRDQERLLTECEGLSDLDPNFNIAWCIEGLVNGTVETDGATPAVAMCRSGVISAKGLDGECYKILASATAEAYSSKHVLSICKSFPREFRYLCT